MKKFLFKLSFTVFPVMLFIIGCMTYLSVYVSPNVSGDIGKLGMIPFGHEYNRFLEQNYLKETLFKTVKQESICEVQTDVLTIGDSFSQQGICGYQNYLAHKNIKVVNCFDNVTDNPLQIAYDLLERDIVNHKLTKVLIVECGERTIEGRFKSFNPNISRKEQQQQPVRVNEPETANNSNDWSVSRARDFILYRIGIDNPIYKATLRHDYFTSNEPNVLYFYNEEIEKGHCLKVSTATKMMEVYKMLQDKAKERGVKLFLMIAVDKYDLYQDYIVDNQYPQKTINEDIERVLPDTPELILTKKYLVPLVEKGEKDVFMFNDTHWSYKASEVVANEIYCRIKDDVNKE